MKNTTIRKAWDTVNPTSAQKKRMRAALEARLSPPSGMPSNKDSRIEKEWEEPFPDLTTMDFAIPQSGRGGKQGETQYHPKTRKKKRPQPGYQSGKPAKKSWGGVFSAVAALLVLAVACGLFLGQMKAGSYDPPSYAAPTETPSTEETETAPGISGLPPAYQDVIRTYQSAIEEDWNMEQCSTAQISILASYVESLDDLGYALKDLDGDGEEELLITDGSEIYSIHALFQDSTQICLSGMERLHYYLCADNIIALEGSGSAATAYCEYYQYGGLGGILWKSIEKIVYDAQRDPENPWFLGDEGKPITEEEANERIAAYPHRYISHKPLSGREVEPEGAVPEDTMIRYSFEIPKLDGYEDLQMPTYCFHDYDGDGENELLIGRGESLYAVINEEKQIYGTEITPWYPMGNLEGQIHLCEGGFLEYTGYSQGYYHSDYFKIHNMRHTERLESVGHNEEGWFAQDQDGTLTAISQEEADAIGGKYQRLILPWKDISEFPAAIPSGERTADDLFESVFLPIATAGKRVTEDELKAKMEENGFQWNIGEGQIYCYASDTCYASVGADLANQDGGLGDELQFHLPDEVNRVVSVKWEGEETRYFTMVDWIGNGVRADSVEELKDFLNADAETLRLRKAAETFAYAYFRKDENGMLESMVSSQTGISPGDLFSGKGDIQIEKITGLEDGEARYAQTGSVTVSAAAYVDSPDSYTYLTMELVKEDEAWKVRSYGLEK